MKKIKYYASCIAGALVFVGLTLVAIWQGIKLRRGNAVAESAVDLAIEQNRKLRKQAAELARKRTEEESKKRIAKVQNELADEAKSSELTLVDVINEMRPDRRGSNDNSN